MFCLLEMALKLRSPLVCACCRPQATIANPHSVLLGHLFCVSGSWSTASPPTLYLGTNGLQPVVPMCGLWGVVHSRVSTRECTIDEWPLVITIMNGYE